ncbi:helix-turn-helix transcriptional regulator [Streptomyces sp. AM 2-1-1]|uniref:helix-turn-helix domain-containing protein n=1 Tax=Streptomyces sp. AM 2-1-1 TaxID=3028709 RepID=UPI0023B94C95|nr:helix-turn-helix transcriptional regulator [Streptomyces sp. AM 2-1-1]WEH44012.1 helix-turn-helix transcriptional regulator [Streptomyces sp. AM 2-1-1]
MPDTDNAVGQLACALRRTRAALGITQGQAADIIGTSASTIQRAEAGLAAPQKSVVDGYVAQLGLNAKGATRLFEQATRPFGRQRRSLTQAPHPGMVSTRDELGRALARVWEEGNRSSMQDLEDRVQAARRDEARKPFVFLSRSAAYRISHRQQLPSGVEQLRAYLYACRIKERQFPVWIQAYHRVKTKDKEENKKTSDTEKHGWWRGYRAQSLADTIMLNAGLHPIEPFPRSATAPWTARCAACDQVGRFRLSAVRAGRGCRWCTTAPP